MYVGSGITTYVHTYVTMESRMQQKSEKFDSRFHVIVCRFLIIDGCSRNQLSLWCNWQLFTRNHSSHCCNHWLFSRNRSSFVTIDGRSRNRLSCWCNRRSFPCKRCDVIDGHSHAIVRRIVDRSHVIIRPFVIIDGRSCNRSSLWHKWWSFSRNRSSFHSRNRLSLRCNRWLCSHNRSSF